MTVSKTPYLYCSRPSVGLTLTVSPDETITGGSAEHNGKPVNLSMGGQTPLVCLGTTKLSHKDQSWTGKLQQYMIQYSIVL